MAQYYAVERSSEYLAHYGVRGMKWGVRKAKEKHNSKALDKHYKKALSKIKKLNTKANVSRSRQEYKGRMSDAAMLGITGAGVAAAGLGIHKLARATNSRAIGIMGGIPFDTETAHYVGGASGALLGGWGAYNVGKGLAAKHRTTAKGHAKAKNKAQEFRNEMGKAFKGTKYAKLPGANGMNKAYDYTPFKDQFKNASTDSVTYVGHSSNKKIARENPGNKPRHAKKRK